MKRLEAITSVYWKVAVAVRHPTAPGMQVGTALKALNASDRLRPEEWRLKDLMHVVRFDIIEGNQEWREKQKANGSVSTLPTRR